MFRMKIECQLNIQDRTLIGGVAEYNVIPKEVKINHKVYKVLGVSYGVKKPKISLEIEKTEDGLQGFYAIAYYTYNISGKYDKKEFENTVEFFKNKVKNIKEMKYTEEPLDGDKLQVIITEDGEIVVKNDFMVGAVWVESNVELNSIF